MGRSTKIKRYENVDYTFMVRGSMGLSQRFGPVDQLLMSHIAPYYIYGEKNYKC